MAAEIEPPEQTEKQALQEPDRKCQEKRPLGSSRKSSIGIEKFNTESLCQGGHDPNGVCAVRAIQSLMAMEGPSTRNVDMSLVDLKEAKQNFKLKYPLKLSEEEKKSRPRISSDEVDKLVENAVMLPIFCLGFHSVENEALRKLKEVVSSQIQSMVKQLLECLSQQRRQTSGAPSNAVHNTLRANRTSVPTLHEFYQVRWRKLCERIINKQELAIAARPEKIVALESSEEPAEPEAAQSNGKRSSCRKRKLRNSTMAGRIKR